MNTHPDISKVASLIGDVTRATILQALVDGRALPASELAYMAKVSPQTVSSHLAKLVEGGLLVAETHGRHRYYKLAGPEVAEALESLSRLAPSVKIRAVRPSSQMQQVRQARTCYDHLAGELGVAVTQALVQKGWLELHGEEYVMTEEGGLGFQELGLVLDSIKKTRRAFAKPCLDWSERRYHLAGSVGKALATLFFEKKWIERDPDCRAVHVTEAGRGVLRERFGVEA